MCFPFVGRDEEDGVNNMSETTRTETEKEKWWNSVKHIHEAGRRARLNGLGRFENPYNINEAARKTWDAGWVAEDAALRRDMETERLASEAAQRRIDARHDHDWHYPDLVEKLRDLNINPYELRDYLAGLPDERE